MKRTICPITKKNLDCLNCKAIKDGEKCPYMVFDEAIEYSLDFIAKLKGEKIEK